MNFHLKPGQAPSYDNSCFTNLKLSYYGTSKHISVCFLCIDKCGLRIPIDLVDHLTRNRTCTLFLIM